MFRTSRNLIGLCPEIWINKKTALHSQGLDVIMYNTVKKCYGPQARGNIYISLCLVDIVCLEVTILKQLQFRAQGYPTARRPRACKIVTRANGFGTKLSSTSYISMFSIRLHSPHCVNNVDTAVLHQANDIICIEKCEILEVGQVKISWYVEPWV